MIIFPMIISFIGGGFVGALMLWRALPSRYRQHVDYKARWHEAVELLSENGNITEKQYHALLAAASADRVVIEKPAPAKPAPVRSNRQTTVIASGGSVAVGGTIRSEQVIQVGRGIRIDQRGIQVGSIFIGNGDD